MSKQSKRQRFYARRRDARVNTRLWSYVEFIVSDPRPAHAAVMREMDLRVQSLCGIGVDMGSPAGDQTVWTRHYWTDGKPAIELIDPYPL